MLSHRDIVSKLNHENDTYYSSIIKFHIIILILLFAYEILSIRASWPGHDVSLPWQPMPDNLLMASSACTPSRSTAPPLVFPSHPLVYCTLVITSLVSHISIWEEHTSTCFCNDVSYISNGVICYYVEVATSHIILFVNVRSKFTLFILLKDINDYL